MLDLIRRLERAADAFLAPRTPEQAIPKPQRGYLGEATSGSFPSLSVDDRQALQNQALALLDGDIVGWWIVTVREAGDAAEVDAAWRMPDAAWPAVSHCLERAR